MRNFGNTKGVGYISLQISLAVAIAVLLVSTAAHAQACPSGTCVQEADNSPIPATSPAAVSVAFANAQTAGNTNVVVAGWGGSSAVLSVTDSAGNTYSQAVGTNTVNIGTSSEVSQSIWYAPNIKGGANTVTVTYNTNTVSYPDVFVLEYSGLSATSPLDVVSGSVGAGSPANSGSATPSGTGDLLVAGGTTTGSFNSSGASFNVRQRTTDGNVVGDQAAVAGANSVSDGVSGSWVLQMAAFSTTAITAGAAPTLAATPITPASGQDTGSDNSADVVTISGTNFRAGAMVLFGTAPTGVSAANCTVASATSIVCNFPPDTAGPKDVTVVNTDGTNASATGAFTFTASNPSITSFTPATGDNNGGNQVVIAGNQFNPGAKVTINDPALEAEGAPALPATVVNLSSTSITAVVPAMPSGSADATVTNTDGGSSGLDSGVYTYSITTGAIHYIQRGDASTGSCCSQTVPVPMLNPQTKGNLNVVIIGWSDTSAQVATVSDTEGNTYTQALNTIVGTGLSQVIYYAKNLAGDGVTPNTITVNFNRPASAPDVRVLEYTGLDPNSPLDQGVSNAGSGSTADTGACTTTSANEVVVAGATVSSLVNGAGAGYTTVDYTKNGDNAEHMITSSIGSCEAQTSLTNGNWVIQSVSLKAAAGAAPGNFSIAANPPTSQTVTAGSSASYALTLAPGNGFNASVTLVCTGLPANATCSFTPKSPVPVSASTPVTMTILTGANTPSGTSTVTVTGTSGALNHTAQVSLTVKANTTPGFTMAATALSPASVSPGGTATSTVTITATNGFTGSVSLSCSSITGGGSPAPTCAFSTISNGTSTLTVSTTASSSSKLQRSTGIFYAMLLPIGGMTLLGAGFSSRRKKLVAIMLLCLAIAGIVFMVACGGGSSSGGGGNGGTPAGTYTITVQGTAMGATTQTQNLTLTVQ